MFIRLLPLLVVGILKYVASRVLFNHFEKLIVKSAQA